VDFSSGREDRRRGEGLAKVVFWEIGTEKRTNIPEQQPSRHRIRPGHWEMIFRFIGSWGGPRQLGPTGTFLPFRVSAIIAMKIRLPGPPNLV
jgi:hypothetical protein